jgi:hypothetical protein
MPKCGVARNFLSAISVCVAKAQIPSGSLDGLVTDPKDAVSNANYAGCNNSFSRYQSAQNGQPAQTVQTNFYSAVNTTGGFLGSGGPRAFQFAARIEF